MMSSSSIYDDVPIPSLHQLSQMMRTNGIPTLLAQAFQSSPTALAHIRAFGYLTNEIHDLQQKLTRHRQEQELYYQTMTSAAFFRETLHPLYSQWRRNQQNIDDNILSEALRLLSPSRSSLVGSQSALSTSSSDESPREVVIHSRPPTPLDDPTEPSSLPLPPPSVQETTPLPLSLEDCNATNNTGPSFQTAITHPSGSATNPIDVDLLPPFVPISVRRTRSAPTTLNCRICRRSGHRLDRCILEGPIICIYCRGVGHVKSDCAEFRRDLRRYNPEMQFCILCSNVGHSVDNCAILNLPQPS